MFSKLFKRKSKKVKNMEISRVKLPEIIDVENEIEKIRNDTIIKFRDTKTGEIYICNMDDEEAFDLFIGNKNMQMVFD